MILETVDRLLKSPTSHRGRDFAIMLKCLEENDYAVEWRVINAAEYGFPQRRRRIFILGYHKSTNQYKQLQKEPLDWIDLDGTIATSFPTGNIENLSELSIENMSLLEVSNSFNKGKKTSFENTSVMINGKIITAKTLQVFQEGILL